MNIALFDADGVVIEPRKRYFSTRYAEKFGVPEELFQPFFKNEYVKCQTNQADLKEVLKDHLRKWRWPGTIDELLAYWFEEGSTPDRAALKIVQSFRKKGVQCYLATDQEKYRAAYLWKTVGLEREFDGAFFSCELGAGKASKHYWQKVLERLGNPTPSEVVFWDDEEENIQAAQNAGIDARPYSGLSDLL